MTKQEIADVLVRLLIDRKALQDQESELRGQLQKQMNVGEVINIHFDQQNYIVTFEESTTKVLNPNDFIRVCIGEEAFIKAAKITIGGLEKALGKKIECNDMMVKHVEFHKKIVIRQEV